MNSRQMALGECKVIYCSNKRTYRAFPIFWTLKAVKWGGGRRHESLPKGNYYWEVPMSTHTNNKNVQRSSREPLNILFVIFTLTIPAGKAGFSVSWSKKSVYLFFFWNDSEFRTWQRHMHCPDHDFPHVAINFCTYLSTGNLLCCSVFLSYYSNTFMFL